MNNQPRRDAGGPPPMIPIGGRRGPGGGGPMAARMSVEKPKNTGRTVARSHGCCITSEKASCF